MIVIDGKRKTNTKRIFDAKIEFSSKIEIDRSATFAKGHELNRPEIFRRNRGGTGCSSVEDKSHDVCKTRSA